MTKKHNEDDFDKAKKATAYAGAGLAAGAVVTEVFGGTGLAVGGTAIAIGAAPVIAAGAVVGLAAYGLKKIFE